MDHDAALPPPELLLQHAGWVRRLAAELVGDSHAADDVAQETWLAFFLRPPDTDRPLRPWLARVVRNRAALRRRGRANRHAREAEVARPEALPSADELVERAELQRTLVDAVLALEEPYRETLLLRYYEGLTPAEIGARRGLPSATVRSHLHRGHEQLRARLDRAHGGDRATWAGLFLPLIERGAHSGTLTHSSVSPTSATVAALSCVVVLCVATAVWIAPWRHSANDDALVGVAPRANEEARAEATSVAPTLPHGARTALVATPAPPTSITVIVVDPRTGEPLPDYTIVALGETRRSDASGRLTLSSSTKSVTPIDDTRLAVDRVVRHGVRARQSLARAEVALVSAEDGSAITLAVPCGPSYRVRLLGDARVEPATLVARLVAAGLSPYLDDGRARQLAPLRGDAGATWVRFGASPEGAGDSRARWSLAVQSADGLWAGAARVADVAVGSSELVELELARMSAIEGTVDAGNGEDPSDVMVTLLRAAPTADGEPALSAATLPDEHGRYTLHALQPGTYELDARSPRHVPITRAVTLAPGERLDVDLALTPLVGGGTLSGSIASESRGYAGQLLVFLMGADGEVLGVFPTTWRVEGGVRIARFEFEDAPAGPLHLDVVSLADAVTFQVAPAPLAAPCATVSLLLLDTRPASDVVFDAVDAHTGAALAAFDVSVEVDGGSPRTYLARERDGARRWTLLAGGMRWNDFDGRAALRRLADDAPFTWRVRARGYREARGSAADALRDADAKLEGDAPAPRRVLARLVPE